MSEQFILNRPLFTDKEKKLVLEEGDPRSAFVIGGKGTPVDEADVEKYGLDDSHRLPSEDATEEASMENAQARTRAISGVTEGETDADSVDADDSGDLESMKVAELRELAEKEEVDLSGITLKADIIAAIQKKRESKD